MPIYEYSCQKCGKIVDLLQKMGTGKAGVRCPACGEDALTKVFSVTAPPQKPLGSIPGCEVAGNRGNCGGCCQGCH